MSRGFGLSWKTALLVLICSLPARSQETQFLPEIDAHLQLKFLAPSVCGSKERSGRW